MKLIRGVVLFLLLGTSLAAQKPDTAPALTEMQRLQVVNALQAVELWQLKAQQAASEFEKARDALQKLVATVTPPGYQLNDKLEFTKTPELVKKP
jgi:hypothetical protein